MTPIALLLLAAAPVQAEPPPPPNVLVWIASGLRADRVSPERAPTIAAFAARALVVEGCLASAPEPPAALASLLTGTFPRVHGLWGAARDDSEEEPPRIPEAVTTLAEAFREGGYYTVCVADGGFVLESRGFDTGFEHFESAYRLAADRAERALEFVESHRPGRPFLFVAQVNQARPPWFAAPEAVERFADPAYEGPLRQVWRRAWGRDGPVFQRGVRNPMGALLRQHWEPALAGELDAADRRFAAAVYDACVWTEDRELGRVLAYLEKRGELASTLVAIVGDHGMALGEQGRVAGEALEEGALAVPLLVAGPGVVPGRLAGLAQTTDLAPTLLALCGLPRPKGMQGRDLLGEGPAEVAIAETRAGGARMLVRAGARSAVLDVDALAGPEGAEERVPPELLRLARAFVERCAATRAALGL